MAMQTINGATLRCTLGAAPSVFQVLPIRRVTVGNLPAATILDNTPLANVMSFGMCSAPANPAVIAATAAKFGVFTPVPCVPATAAPWIPGAPTVLIGAVPALDHSCKLTCQWAGIIGFVTPGQATVSIS